MGCDMVLMDWNKYSANDEFRVNLINSIGREITCLNAKNYKYTFPNYNSDS